MVHGVEQLVFVHKMTNDEVYQTGEEDHPRRAENTVDSANDEDQNRLREEEAVTEHRGLDQLGIVYANGK